nr:hypothetical protein [Tanacetum cinerariifolium]
MYPPSPDYVPEPEHPLSPDYVPSPKHPPLPVYVPYVPEHVYLEFMPLEDDSDPEEDPNEDDEDPKEDPADYPIDRDDDDEEEEESFRDDTSIPHLSETEVSILLAIPTPSPLTLAPYSSLLPQIPSPPLPTSPTHLLGYQDAMIWLRAESPSTSHPLPTPIVLPHTMASMAMMRAAAPSTYILAPRSETPPSRTPPLLPIPVSSILVGILPLSHSSPSYLRTAISNYGVSLGPEHADDEIVTKDQPYAEDASPIAQSPEYIPESDFEMHLEDDDDEDPEEDRVDYPADGGDDGDDEEESSEDEEEYEDDEMDIEADEEEDEEHPAPVDSVVVAPTAADQAPSAEETEPFETDESAATPQPHPAYRTTARISIPA